MSRTAFEVLVWDLARVSELFSFHEQGMHDVAWGIKGHNRPWIAAHGEWAPGLRFLDVGAGFSDLASFLARTHGAEAWVADDFGASQGEQIWSRWGDPAEMPQKHPEVKYVFKNLGQDVPEIPEASFDRVYSVSVLEHVPPEKIAAVLKHMGKLLKPGGLLMCSIDIPFPRTVTRPGIGQVTLFLARVAGRRVLTWLGAWTGRPYTRSVEGWSHLLRRVFKIHGQMRGISTANMVLAHDVLTEPPEIVYRLYPPNDEPKPYWRIASLLLILRKLV